MNTWQHLDRAINTVLGVFIAAFVALTGYLTVTKAPMDEATTLVTHLLTVALTAFTVLGVTIGTVAYRNRRA